MIVAPDAFQSPGRRSPIEVELVAERAYFW
jgi:hypothetical protein